jgi:hypothetical protein
MLELLWSMNLLDYLDFRMLLKQHPAIFLHLAVDHIYAWHFAWFLYNHKIAFFEFNSVTEDTPRTQRKFAEIYFPCEAVQVFFHSLGITDIFDAPFEDYTPNETMLSEVKKDLYRAGFGFKKRQNVTYFLLFTKNDMEKHHITDSLSLTDLDYLDMRTFVKSTPPLYKSIQDQHLYACEFHLYLSNYDIVHPDYGILKTDMKGNSVLLNILRYFNPKARNENWMVLPICFQKCVPGFLREMQKLGFQQKFKLSQPVPKSDTYPEPPFSLSISPASTCSSCPARYQSAGCPEDTPDSARELPRCEPFPGQ